MELVHVLAHLVVQLSGIRAEVDALWGSVAREGGSSRHPHTDLTKNERTLESCVSCVALVNCSRAVLRSATNFPVARPAMRASWGTSFLPATRVWD